MMSGSFLNMYVLVLLTSSLVLSVSCSKKEWNYVVLGDSSAWGFSKYYAAHIEEDMGIKVTVHDRTVGGLSSGQLLSMLRDDQKLRSAISEAEVVTFIANPGDHIGWHIITGKGWHDCSPEALAGYKSDLDEIIKEIFALRKGTPTIIRAMDFYVPIHSEWKKRGEYEENRRCWNALNETIHQAAAEHNIPVAHVYDAFNGPDHNEDPRDKGYIRDDGLHTNEEGQKVIADLFRKLGYKRIIP
ncbi:MAG: SGNH/GDSL hydrolase family protein [candidate division WOR-3 bacterium]|nr:MAG: SGNH/GDSL hydrolase family protein [candidate division WOR-3 bacterium]